MTFWTVVCSCLVLMLHMPLHLFDCKVPCISLLFSYTLSVREARLCNLPNPPPPPPVWTLLTADSPCSSTNSSVLCIPCKLAARSRRLIGFPSDLFGKTTAVFFSCQEVHNIHLSCSWGSEKLEIVLRYINSLRVTNSHSQILPFAFHLLPERFSQRTVLPIVCTYFLVLSYF